MPKGILTQHERMPVFYLHYEGIQKPIGRVLVKGPIGNPDHYLIKWDRQNKCDFSDIDIAHSYEEALQKAHNFAIQDLSAQTQCDLEDRTRFANANPLEQTASQPRIIKSRQAVIREEVTWDINRPTGCQDPSD